VANVLGHKIALKGPGNGTATVLDNHVIQIDDTGSTAASALSVTGGGDATLGNVTVNGSLKSFTGKTADLAGDVSVTGTLGKFTARNATGGHALNIGGTTLATSIALGNAADLSIVSAEPLKSVKAQALTNTDNVADTLDAPMLASLSVKGDMAAHIKVGTLGKVSVGGAITGADVRADSSIASVRAGAIHDSDILAGVRSDLAGLPAALSDFTNPAGLIKSLSVSGKAPGSFSDTIIAAADLGKISLGAVQTTNNGTPDGVAADKIASISAAFGADKIRLKNLDAPTDSQTQDDFNLRLL
jgi:hypothetical protein